MTAATATASPFTADDRRFLGHPIGLGYLAFTEAWERFSYYGMQALLALYMVKELLLPGHIENVAFFDSFRKLYGGLEGQALASAIFGTYSASVYLTPIAGGWLADRFLGKKNAVLIGAITMAIGHFLMAFEVSFLFALLALIIGSGFLKGNIASLVGSLYSAADLRRADAFQIFYLGINAGVIAAPLIVGTLGEKIGWHWGFGAAGIGMLIGLGIYIAGLKHMPADQLERRDGSALKPKLERHEWPQLIALILLIPVMAVAIVPNNQIFNAYLIWGDAQFALSWGGEKLPTTWLVTLDAIVSVSLLLGVALFYRWYGKHYQEPDEITKMIIGAAFSVLGTLCLVAAAATQGPGEKIGLFWPVLFHVINSIGFAHMLPVSLALFSKVAPKAVNATVIGLYYLAFFTGNAMVGAVGARLETMPIIQFWLMHTAFAGAALVAFIAFRIFGRRFLAGGG
jgi:proton-dependent oligopeptide transporter, POT family